MLSVSPMLQMAYPGIGCTRVVIGRQSDCVAKRYHLYIFPFTASAIRNKHLKATKAVYQERNTGGDIDKQETLKKATLFKDGTFQNPCVDRERSWYPWEEVEP
jgi:hypothetical protein